MTTPDPNDFLMGGGIPSAKFPAIGTSYTGTITEKPFVMQQRDPATNKLKFWDDGSPMNQLVVTVQTALRDPALVNDVGLRRFYVKAQLTAAVRDAVRAVGASGLEIGGTLVVTYIADGPQENLALSKPKLFSVTYAAPNASAGFLTETNAPASPAAAPAAAAPASPGYTPEQLAAMQAAGVDISRFPVSV